MADWMLADSSCQSHILDLTTPLFVAISETHQGIDAQVKKLCPWCTLQTETIDFSQDATQVPQLIDSAFSRNPSINEVTPEADGPALYAAPAIKAKNSKVHLIGHDGATPNLAFVRSGEQAAGLVYPPPTYIAYLELDEMLYAMSHVSPLPSGVFYDKLITQQNIPASNADLFPELAGFQTKFEADWIHGT